MEIENTDSLYSSLMALDSLAGIPDQEALGVLGSLVNTAGDKGDINGLEKAKLFASELEGRGFQGQLLLLLNYFISNLYSHCFTLAAQHSENQFPWESKDVENSIIYLRLARWSDDFDSLGTDNKCRILTNLGNELDRIGRFAEAIEYWNEALQICPSFGMALGNRGFGLMHYAHAHYDNNDRYVLLKHAYDDLHASLSLPLYEHAQEIFRSSLEAIVTWVGGDKISLPLEMYDAGLGKNKMERDYRQWCLTNRMFLNSMNDVQCHPSAAEDVLTTPDIVTGLDEGPGYQGFFNQMKQEYVSARFVYYEGVIGSRLHFSDRGVVLFNTLDYPAYSIHIEKVRMAYRVAYSLFDKIAWFLHKYLKLGSHLSEGQKNRITFRTIWYENLQYKRGLWPDLQQLKNWPFHGLFWLSKDLFENRSEFKQAMQPDAQELSDIRNHLEHKYLKAHTEMLLKTIVPSSGIDDELAYSVDRQEFEKKALRVLKMARSALVYLSLGIHAEERRREQEHLTKGGHIVPVNIGVFDDSWKY